MMSEVPELSHSVTHYASHRQCANVQFPAILKKYAVNKNRSIHHLYGSIPQSEGFEDEES